MQYFFQNSTFAQTMKTEEIAECTKIEKKENEKSTHNMLLKGHSITLQMM